MEKTLFIVKPDGLERGLLGQVLTRIENRGFEIEALELRQPDAALIDEHYKELLDKPFYPSIRDFMLSGPCVVGVIKGPAVISSWRKMMGATRPEEAEAGTIRGDFAHGADPGQAIMNVVHGSDCQESAEREIALWFGK